MPSFVPTPPPFPPPPAPARSARGSVGRHLSPTSPKPPSPKSVPRPNLARGHAPARTSSSSSSSRPARPSTSSSTSAIPSSSSTVPPAAASYARFLEVFNEMQDAADAAGVDLNLAVNLPTVDEVALKLEEEAAAGDDAAEEEAEAEEETGRVELAVVEGKAPWADRHGASVPKGKGDKGKAKGKANKGGQIRMRDDGGLSCVSCVGCCVQ